MTLAPFALVERVSWLGDDGRAVLDGVSLGVARGEALALVGHNDGGKPTALRLLAGLVQPSRGRVLAFGLDLSRATYAELLAHRRRVGFVFEAGGLWANRTIFDNIVLPLAYHQPGSGGLASLRARVQGLAEELGIAGWLEQPSTRYNASVRKRALVARALAGDPELLLCDEPQLGLVPGEASLVGDAIERRRALGLTVVFADHDGLLEPFRAARFVYFEDGRMLRRPSLLPPPDRLVDSSLMTNPVSTSGVLGGA